MNRTILFLLLFFIGSCGDERAYIFSSASTASTEEAEEEDLVMEDAPCKQEGKACSEDRKCKMFCDDLFSHYKGKENCYKWSYSFFKDFKKLADQLKTFSFLDLDFPTAKCFFKMTENHKTSLFKNFTEESAEKFLIQIAKNEPLAHPIFQSDKKGFEILEDLFSKLDRRVQRAIRAEIYSDSHFLILAHKYKNRSAWYWIDSFIRYDCKKTSSCQHPLEYYCEILEDTYRGDLEDFFENHWFEKAYKGDIEAMACDSYDCEYGKVSDFKEFCEKI